jgi:2'-5' RNA ligase
MTTDLGIFLPCDDKATEYAIGLAHIIETTNLVKTSLSFGYLPHISLFQGRFLNTNIDKLIEITKSVFSNISSFPIKLDSQLQIRSNGNIFWNAEKSETLQSLHKLALKNFHPLTKGLLMDQMQKLLQQTNISQRQRYLIENFGSPLSAENFTPHITICNVNDIKSKKSISEIKPPSYSWTVFEYQIGTLRSDGSIAEVIVTDKLKTET